MNLASMSVWICFSCMFSRTRKPFSCKVNQPTNQIYVNANDTLGTLAAFIIWTSWRQVLKHQNLRHCQEWSMDNLPKLENAELDSRSLAVVAHVENDNRRFRLSLRRQNLQEKHSGYIWWMCDFELYIVVCIIENEWIKAYFLSQKFSENFLTLYRATLVSLCRANRALIYKSNTN